jgi:hypothetical protein
MQQINEIKAAFELYFKHLMHGSGDASVHSQQSHEDELIESASERKRKLTYLLKKVIIRGELDFYSK